MKVFSCSQRRVFYRNIVGSSCCSYCLILLLLLLSFVDFFVRTFLESSCQEQILHLTKTLKLVFSQIFFTGESQFEWIWLNEWKQSQREGQLKSVHRLVKRVTLCNSLYRIIKIRNTKLVISMPGHTLQLKL